MAIKVNGTEVISTTRVLSNITDADAASETVINNAVINNNNVLRIYNSAGVEVRTLFCAGTA
tara:strand:- start:30 stop:215 length:186 start_codon:yes stop_codon:yes gene_type:complete